jgi:GTP-binding protein Era
MHSNDAGFKSAFVALAGRPNCGKSTLLNTILGERLSIVTSLPQTTRRNLRGIYSDAHRQIVFIDTPGIHRGKHALNKSMYSQSAGLLQSGDVDIICYMVDLCRRFGDEEDAAAKIMTGQSVQLCIVFNKADLCPSPDERRSEFFERYPSLASHATVTLSAVEPAAKDIFLDALMPMLKAGPKYYSDDEFTDANMRFLAGEMIRKHIIEATREEVPHAACVEIVSYEESASKHIINAAVHVETKGQKGILIGARGSRIRSIQKAAQADISRFVGKPVALACHVRVTPKWRDNRRFLREMGMESAD